MKVCWQSTGALLAALALGTAAFPARAQDADEIPGVPEGAAEQDDPTARLQWELDTFGKVTATFRTNELKQVNIHNTKKNQPGPRWVNIGPTGADFEQNGSFTGHVRDSGRARGFLFHPIDPDIAYVLTSGGGLWKTTSWTSPNTTWSPLTDNVLTTGGGAVSFGKNASTLYLGLGDPYDQILAGGAIQKSTNAGTSWSAPIELGNAVSVRDIKVDGSAKNDIVMAATDQGLFRSVNAGTSYSSISTFANQSVWSIVQTSAGWLASAQPCNPNPNSTRPYGVLCGFATKLYVSTDHGGSWAPIPNAGNVFSANGRTTLAVGTPGDAIVYAYSSRQDESQMRDVYRSTDGGLNWSANGVNSTKAPTNPLSGGGSSELNMNICHGQCWYDQSIAVDPSDPSRNTVWIGGDLATAQSTDGGATWRLATWWLYSDYPAVPYAHADHHVAVFKTTGTPTLVLGDDGGFNISTDGGASFSSDKNNGLTTHLFYTLTGNSRFPNLVLGGLQDNGTRLRTDNGGTYDQVIGGDGLGAAYSIDNTHTVMGSSQSSGIRTNLSDTPPVVYQNQVARGGLSDSAAPFSTCIVPAPTGLDATGRVFFHFTTNRIHKTTDGGLTWAVIASTTTPISTGFPSPSGTRTFRSSTSNLGISPLDLNHIAIGAGGGFLDISTDGGASWTDVNLTTIPGLGYVGFTTNVEWQDNQNLWITSSAVIPAGAGHVVKAHIANPADPWSSATYTLMQNGLPDLPVQRVYFDPRDASRSTIYAASHVGLYRTTDGGGSWAPYGNGLPTVRVADIYMPKDGSFMRIATYGRGIWELGQIELVSAAITDNVVTCDNDGVLDNGETGTLSVTLTNQGANNVNQGTITFSSSNPHLTFPAGAVVTAPSIGPKGTAVAAIPVALNGASGIETADISIVIDVPQLALGSTFNLKTTQRLNYDDAAGVSATDSFESKTSAWTASSSGSLDSPNLNTWQIRELSSVQHAMWGPDNNGQRDDVKSDAIDDQYLTSPVLNVGGDPLVISFSHRHAFEFAIVSGVTRNFDAGLVELSSDGGATWTDIGAIAGVYNGATYSGATGSIGGSHPAFVNRNAGWPAFVPVTMNLGTAYAGQNVQIRFHISVDNATGAPGWDIDDVAVSGITNTPFSGLVPNACP